MRFLFYAFTLMSALLVSSIEAADRLEEFAHYDRTYNIPKYRETRDQRAKEEALESLDYWELSPREIWIRGFDLVIQQHSVDEVSRQLHLDFFAPREGVQRLFASRKITPKLYERYEKAFGPAHGSFPSLRMSGHSTHIVYLPSGRLVVKMTAERSGPSETLNAPSFIRRGTETSTKLEADLEDFGYSPHIAESLFFGVVDRMELKWLQGIVMRELETKLTALEDPLTAYPLHAFLDPDSLLVSEHAQKKNMTGYEWIQNEYIPKLSEFFAFLHFQVGYLHQSHTQNLIIVTNPTKGTIEDFFVRDLQDSVFFDLARLHQHRYPAELSLEGISPSRIFNGDFRTEEMGHQLDNTLPGTVVSEYVGQSVAYFANHSPTEASLSLQFLEAYRLAVERETGYQLPKSEAAKKAEDSLRAKNISSRALIVDAMHTAVNDIFLSFIQTYFKQSITPASFDFDQRVLNRMFAFGKADEEVSLLPNFSRPDAKPSFSTYQPVRSLYGYDGRVLFQLDAEKGDVIAFIPLTQEDRDLVQGVLRRSWQTRKVKPFGPEYSIVDDSKPTADSKFEAALRAGDYGTFYIHNYQLLLRLMREKEELVWEELPNGTRGYLRALGKGPVLTLLGEVDCRNALKALFRPGGLTNSTDFSVSRASLRP